MNLVLLDSFNLGGLERRYLSIIRHLIENKLDNRFYFFVNRACLKNRNDLIFFSRQEKVKVYGIGERFYKIPILRFIEYKWQLFISYLQFLFIKKKSFKTTFFIGVDSLRFVSYIKSEYRIFELVYSGDINNHIEFTQVFKRTQKYPFHFLCLTESIYKTATQLGKGLLNVNSTVRFSNKSFCNITTSSNDNLIKEKVVTYLARFDRGKGIDLLLSIMNLTLKIDDNIKFNIIGYGKRKNYIDEYVKTNLWHYQQNIQIIETTTPSDFLKHSLIFLSLQENENFPSQSALEAMAHNNYILVTDVGMSRLLVSNNNGESLPPDPVVFANRILKLANDPIHTARLGRNSNSLLSREFSIESYISFLEGNFFLFS